MTAPALLSALREAGFRVRAEGGRLLVTPPGGAWHPDDAAVIRAAKAGLLGALAAEAVTARVAREVWPPDPPAWPGPAVWPLPPGCPGRCPWCEPRRRPDGPVAGQCRWCDRPAEFLCDFVTEVWTKSGRRPERWDGRTCDAPFCKAHGHRAGVTFLDYADKRGRRKGHAETTDYCPDHAPRKE